MKMIKDLFGKKEEKSIDMPEEVLNEMNKAATGNPEAIKAQMTNKSENQHKSMVGAASSPNGFGYDIELYDVWDTTSRRIPSFGANRVIEGDNVYLYNPKNGFKVPFPENSEEYKQYIESELDEVIKNTETKIKKVKDNKLGLSLKDLNKDLRIYKNYKRSLELQGRGSYMIINSNGRPLFMFDRIGNLKMPLFKNVDRSLIYTPTEQKTQETVQLLKENQEKNGEKEMLKLSNYVVLLLMVLALCFIIWMGYKMSHLPVDVTTNLADTTKMLAEVTKDLNNVSFNINSIAESTQSTIPSTTPITQTITGR